MHHVKWCLGAGFIECWLNRDWLIVCAENKYKHDLRHIMTLNARVGYLLRNQHCCFFKPAMSAITPPFLFFLFNLPTFCPGRCHCRAVAMSIHFSGNCRAVAMHIFMETMGSLLALCFSSRSLPQVKPSLPYTGIVCGKFNLPIRASSRSNWAKCDCLSCFISSKARFR